MWPNSLSSEANSWLKRQQRAEVGLLVEGVDAADQVVHVDLAARGGVDAEVGGVLGLAVGGRGKGARRRGVVGLAGQFLGATTAGDHRHRGHGDDRRQPPP
jgi:hypothetical protein